MALRAMHIVTGYIASAAMFASAFVASAQPAYAAGQWYVRADGSDSPACGTSSGAPCATVSYVLNKPAFADGDQVNVLAHANAVEDIIVVTRSLTLAGEGQAVSIIDGGGAGRVLLVKPGANVVVSNLTVRNGSVADGGGIYNEGNTQLLNSAVLSSTAESGNGGGIYNTGVLTATNSLVQGNSLPSGSGGLGGGGIYNANTGRISLINSTVMGNRADSNSGSGGGIENDGGQLSISGGSIRFNNATYGGGIDLNGGETHIDGVIFDGNTASQGGGISNYIGALSVDKSAVIRNLATNGGGGIYSAAAMTLTNVTVGENTASSGLGSAVWNESPLGIAKLVHVTIANNHAINRNNAGASSVYVYLGATVSMRATVLAGHDPRNCWLDGGSATSAGDNISDDADCSFLSQPSDQQSTDPRLGSLTAMGGTSLYPLGHNSPAMNVIDPPCVAATDQRGVNRPQMSKCDVGAYEAEPVAVALSAASTPATLFAGEKLTATLSVNNAGSNVATGVVVSGSLPQGTAVASCSVSQGSCNAASGVMSATLGSLAGGASALVVVQLVPNASGPWSMGFTATSDQPDNNASDDTANVSANVTAAADLGISVSVPTPVSAGADVTYTVVVSNVAGAAAESPQVAVTLPQSLTYRSAVGNDWQCTLVSTVVKCNYAPSQFAVGLKSTIHIRVGTPVANVHLETTWSVSSSTYDPFTANNAAIADSTVETQTVSISKTVSLPIVVR